MKKARRLQQPELQNAFGSRFRGRAETITGDVWWYTKDGKRYPLLPVAASADPPLDWESKDGDK